VSDIVKRLHRQIILIVMVGGDPDLKMVLEEAKAEIIKLREERVTNEELEAIQEALTLEWPHTSEQWEALAGCVGPVCKVPANKYKVAIRVFLRRQPKPPGPETKEVGRG